MILKKPAEERENFNWSEIKNKRELINKREIINKNTTRLKIALMNQSKTNHQ